MKYLYIILFSVISFYSCKNEKGIKIEDINQNCKANAISNEQLADLLYSKDLKGVQFIDIRTPHKYAIGHLPGAINIPMKNFFNNEYFSKINNDDVIILYGDDASMPRLAALMSGHFNKGKFYVALGGYDYINKHILRGYSIHSGLYNDEIPLVDYQQVVNEIKSRAGGGVSKPKKVSTPGKPVVKRKKKEVSGGCG